jgi:hypothetical protein
MTNSTYVELAKQNWTNAHFFEKNNLKIKTKQYKSRLKVEYTRF